MPGNLVFLQQNLPYIQNAQIVTTKLMTHYSFRSDEEPVSMDQPFLPGFLMQGRREVFRWCLRGILGFQFYLFSGQAYHGGLKQQTSKTGYFPAQWCFCSCCSNVKNEKHLKRVHQCIKSSRTHILLLPAT